MGSLTENLDLGFRSKLSLSWIGRDRDGREVLSILQPANQAGLFPRTPVLIQPTEPSLWCENRPILDGWRELEYRVLYGNPQEDRGMIWTPGWGRVRVNAFYVPLVPKPKVKRAQPPFDRLSYTCPLNGSPICRIWSLSTLVRSPQRV